MERVVNTEATSDRELVARCRAGEEGAFDELVTRHQQRALNVAYQVTRDFEDAAEIAQDAFVNVYRNIGTFRGECEFTTWLHQIVVNLARNRRRWWHRRGRETTISMDCPVATAEGELVREVAAATAAPDVEAVRAEYGRQLSVMLGRLPVKFREVLVLRNVEDLSYEEMAMALRCSVGTVKSRLARARDQLRKAMSEE